MEDELLEINWSPSSDHLSLRVEFYFRACETGVLNERPWSWAIVRRWSLSSVLHAFCGLDSAVNQVGHEILFDADSPRYIPHSDRDLVLSRFVQGWSIKLPCVEKVKYVLSVEGKTLDARLENEIRELNTFRNMIAHGSIYRSVILAVKQPEGHSREVDREDSVDWIRKFPNSKFNATDLIDESDARTANRIALEAVKLITEDSDSGCWLAPYWKGIDQHSSIDQDFDPKTYLDLWKQVVPSAT